MACSFRFFMSSQAWLTYEPLQAREHVISIHYNKYNNALIDVMKSFMTLSNCSVKFGWRDFKISIKTHFSYIWLSAVWCPVSAMNLLRYIVGFCEHTRYSSLVIHMAGILPKNSTGFSEYSTALDFPYALNHLFPFPCSLLNRSLLHDSEEN